MREPLTDAPESPLLAVYWHFEDLVSAEYDGCHGAGEWRRDRVGAPWTPAGLGAKIADARINVPAAMTYAQTLGPVVINRIYADWTRQVFRDYRRLATEQAPVEFVQIHRTAVPVALRLPADVVSDLRRNPLITDVLVFSGTWGFPGLAAHCRAVDRRMHAIAKTATPNAPWFADCAFHYYSNVVPPLADARLPSWASLVTAPFDAEPDRRITLNVFKKELRATDQSFHERNYGYRVFSDFVRAAAGRGLLLLEDNGADGRWVRRGPTEVAEEPAGR